MLISTGNINQDYDVLDAILVYAFDEDTKVSLVALLTPSFSVC